MKQNKNPAMTSFKLKQEKQQWQDTTSSWLHYHILFPVKQHAHENSYGWYLKGIFSNSVITNTWELDGDITPSMNVTLADLKKYQIP